MSEVAGIQVDQFKEFVKEREIRILAAQGVIGAAGAVICKARPGSRLVGLFANAARQVTWQEGLKFLGRRH